MAKLAKLPMNAAVLALAVQCLVEVPRAEKWPGAYRVRQYALLRQREICTKRVSLVFFLAAALGGIEVPPGEPSR